VIRNADWLIDRARGGEDGGRSLPGNTRTGSARKEVLHRAGAGALFQPATAQLARRRSRDLMASTLCVIQRRVNTSRLVHSAQPDSEPVRVTDLASASGGPAGIGSFRPAARRDPPWSGWDVLALAILTVVTMFVSVVVSRTRSTSYFLPTPLGADRQPAPKRYVGGVLAYLLIAF